MSQSNPSAIPAAKRPNPAMQWLTVRGVGMHNFLYKRRIARNMGPNRLVLVTVKGRKSGKPITVPLGTFRDGNDIIVIASMGGADFDPQWWLNMLANPDVTVQDGDAITKGRVEWISDPGQRADLWKRITAAMPNYGAYEKKTSRVIPLGRIRHVP